ncbi:hypothetical protein [Gymnodinialimonas hymeniacidonis]|uniref:hypothetical protein n=1 Tax=Gymnodinialimonas hymeniacidonis TaxID=3126508 RepID=UPI0034C5F015
MLAALAAPFRHGSGACRAALVMFGLPFAATIALQFATGLILAGHYTRDFWAADGSGDPVMLQHLMWIAGHPETLIAILVVNGIILGPWGLAIWWRALGGVGGWRVPFAQILRVAGLLLLVLAPFLLEALLLARWPILPPSIDIVIWVLVPMISVLAFLKLAPRFAAALERSRGPTPGWGRVAVTAAAFAVFALCLQIPAVLGWMGVEAFAQVVLSSDWNPPLWVAHFLFMDWQMILSQLAVVYSALVLIALAYRLTQPQIETTASAA